MYIHGRYRLSGGSGLLLASLSDAALTTHEIMSPRYASRTLLLFLTLWWGPTTATTSYYFRMTEENAAAGNANTAPSYPGHCDASIKASDIPSKKYEIIATLDLDNTRETEPHYGFLRWGIMSHLQQKGNLHDQNHEYLTGTKKPAEKTADGRCLFSFGGAILARLD